MAKRKRRRERAARRRRALRRERLIQLEDGLRGSAAEAPSCRAPDPAGARPREALELDGEPLGAGYRPLGASRGRAAERRRDGFANGLRILMFLAAICGGALAFPLLGGRQVVSELENRRLAPLPVLSLEAYASGSFAPAFEAWFQDAFPLRESLVAAGRALDGLRGLRGGDHAELVRARGAGEFAEAAPLPGAAEAGAEKGSPSLMASAASATDASLGATERRATSVAAASAFAPGAASGPGVQVAAVAKPGDPGAVGDFLVLDDYAMEVINFREWAADAWAGAVNEFVRGLDPGVVARVLIAPSRIAFLEDERYRSLSFDQGAAIARVHAALDERLVRVDAWTALREHRDEYIYFRTDHHWTALGAYYAYRAYAEAAGLEPLPLSAYRSVDLEGFVGTLYGKTLSPRLKERPDTVRVYEPPVATEYAYYRIGAEAAAPGRLVDYARADSWNKYLVFLGDDYPLATIVRPGAEGKKLLVFKDSYGNALVPFLTPHYREIHVIDPRHYQGDALAYARSGGFDEVLFANYFVVLSWYDGYARNLRRVSGAGARVPTTEATPVSAAVPAAPTPGRSPDKPADAPAKPGASSPAH